jgi:hypothetical protein
MNDHVPVGHGRHRKLIELQRRAMNESFGDEKWQRVQVQRHGVLGRK